MELALHRQEWGDNAGESSDSDVGDQGPGARSSGPVARFAAPVPCSELDRARRLRMVEELGSALASASGPG
eukprot:6540204-Lingulodinium_polyedra.AAC.1